MQKARCTKGNSAWHCAKIGGRSRDRKSLLAIVSLREQNFHPVARLGLEPFVKWHWRKALLLIFGMLFIAFGVGAFFGVPGAHDAGHHAPGHNITHIVAGLVVLNIALAGPPGVRRLFCFGFGAIYLAIGVFGLFSVQDSLRIIPGMIEFHLEDDWVQIGTGVLFLALGFLKKAEPLIQERSLDLAKEEI